MANSFTPSVDYSLVLSDLRKKRSILEQEYEAKLEVIDNAIDGIQLLYDPIEKSIPSVNNTMTDIKNMGVYEAACYVLEKVGKPLSSLEIVETFNNNGRKSEYPNVASTLYRAIKEKTDCKIQRLGKGTEGKWGLVS